MCGRKKGIDDRVGESVLNEFGIAKRMKKKKIGLLKGYTKDSSSAYRREKEDDSVECLLEN